MNVNIIKRILEPVLLGSTVSIIINSIMNPASFEFIPGKFIIAIILFTSLTELNRYIDRKLDNKISWTEYPFKRFATHFLLILLSLVMLLNPLGLIYMWIIKKSFFSLKEIIIINVATLSLTVFLTVIKWTVHFYLRFGFLRRTMHQRN